MSYYKILRYSGVLKGEPGEVASAMQFKPNYESGALLTVVNNFHQTYSKYVIKCL